MIKTIFSCDKNRRVCTTNTLSWASTSYHLKWFNNVTNGQVVMMCKDTWQNSVLPKPLSNRYNILISDSFVASDDTRPNIVISEKDIPKYLYTIQKDIWIITNYNIIQANIDFIDQLYIINSLDDYKKGYRLSNAKLSSLAFNLDKIRTDYGLPIELWSKQ